MTGEEYLLEMENININMTFYGTKVLKGTREVLKKEKLEAQESRRIGDE